MIRNSYILVHFKVVVLVRHLVFSVCMLRCEVPGYRAQQKQVKDGSKAHSGIVMGLFLKSYHEAERLTPLYSLTSKSQRRQKFCDA